MNMLTTKFAADNIYQLANQISLEDLETIMAIFHDRIFVYDMRTRVMHDDIDTCINGTSIQINIKE